MGYYEPTVGCTENFVQMMGRVRDIKTKEYHIFINQKEYKIKN